MPTVACYCQDFLKSDMQHIHRQIVSLKRWQPTIITQKRENAAQFPFPSKAKRLTVLPPLRWKNFRRAWHQHVLRTPLTIPASRVQRLLYETMRHDAAVCHIFFGHIGVQLLPFIAASVRPVIVSFHGADAGIDSQKPAWTHALRQVFRHSTLILARSAALLTDLTNLGCPPEKLRLQRTGIPLDAWPYIPRTVPADGAWHFLQACRLVPKKGLRTTLRAFTQIAQHYPLATLTLAGDGPLLPELRAAAAATGLAHRIHFPGFLDQAALKEKIGAAHVFFHPSETPPDGNREGVPNAMLEAMASGLPVLATHHGGIPEAITHRHTGLLTPERDHHALAASALALLADPTAYQQMGKAAAASVSENFERHTQTALLETYYDQAAAAKPLR